MPSLLDADPKLLYTMLKGGPGLRKSTCALSYPGPQYWFSWDIKMQSLLLPMKHWGIDPSTIQYDDYDDWSKAEAKLKSFQQKCDFNTLVFDSITSLGDASLNQILKEKGGAVRSSGATAGKKIGGIEVNELEDFNGESAAIGKLISFTKDIQAYNKRQGRYINIILIAHVLEVTNKPLNGPMTISTSIVTAAKKNAAKIPAYCSEVYHFGVKKSMIEGQGGPILCATYNTGDDFARTALPLPPTIEITNDNFYLTNIAPAIKKLSSSIGDSNKK